jgi:diguanylate cyclase (GGDEF)-like protein
VACRYGGEEFIIVVPNATPNLTIERAIRIREEVKKIRIVHNGKELNTLSISAGVAVYPQHGKDVDSLVQAADAALYKAKAQGRDQVHVAVVPADENGSTDHIGIPQQTDHKDQQS